MYLGDFKEPVGEWLRGEGSEADLVISSRVRLARNLTDVPFTTVANDRQRAEVADRIQDSLDTLRPGLSLKIQHLEELDDVEKLVLVERHLISRELAMASGPRVVAHDETESFSLMGNEEDHLRLQVVKSGYRLEEAWQQMDHLEKAIDSELQFAFDKKFGYLTACPTNVGTGLRASVMLHLPAMMITGKIEEVNRAATKLHLAIRGLFGEGTEAQGDFFQISNQRTLGETEEKILQNIAEVLPKILSYERTLRGQLFEQRKEWTEDRVGRAFGILSHARVIQSKEALDHLSLMRLGVSMGILQDLTMDQVNRMFLYSQPGHLQAIDGQELSPAERDLKRADLLRKILSE
jgi:protein arginine kinase